MQTERLTELLNRFGKNPPASATDIDAVERQLEVPLPADYRAFLMFTDGGEGFIGTDSYAQLWKVGDLVQFNREYEVEQCAPGLLLFGSSGGGEGFAFDLRDASQPVVSVPFIVMDLKVLIPFCATLDEFLENISYQK